MSFVRVVYAWLRCKNVMDCISKQILTLLFVNRGGFVLIFSKPACFLSGCFNGSHAISTLAHFSGPYHKDEMHKLARRINMTYSNYLHYACVLDGNGPQGQNSKYYQRNCLNYPYCFNTHAYMWKSYHKERRIEYWNSLYIFFICMRVCENIPERQER